MPPRKTRAKLRAAVAVKTAPRRRGRPSVYTDALAREIERWLISGRSLASFCRQAGKPAETTVWSWATDPDHDFAARYTRARELQAHAMVDRLRDVTTGVAPDDVGAAKLEMDAIKWMAGKMLPNVYGDKPAILNTVVNAQATIKAGDQDKLRRLVEDWRADARRKLGLPDGGGPAAPHALGTD